MISRFAVLLPLFCQHAKSFQFASYQASSLSPSVLFARTTLIATAMSTVTSAEDGGPPSYYRKDGVRITHDPYQPGMAEKYGLPGNTDPEGFDPYADTVGPGIYGGSVERDDQGEIVIGEQYQNHNNRPGPVYDGRGYSIMSRALHMLSLIHI